MDRNVMTEELSIMDRLAAIREAKRQQTVEKQRVIRIMDYDDHALILPPPERRHLVESISGSGVPINDVLIQGIEMESNHESGGFFGPKAVGANFRRLLEAHPAYVDPMSSLAGGYMVNFLSYRKVGWKPELDFSHLTEVRERYQLVGGIGASQHFCQDLAIGLELGWKGIQAKIDRHRPEHPQSADFYDGLEHVVKGIQSWIRTHVLEARRLSQEEDRPEVKANLLEMALMNERLITEPAQTFRESCQWILWYQMAARMFNGSGSLGRLDLLLWPSFQRDKALGQLSDEEAMFHIACLLARDTAYVQLGGLDRSGRDATNALSFITLEAVHHLGIPSNVAVCVGDGVNEDLLRRAVEILLEDRLGIPKFLGIERTAEGFSRNGFPMELARERAYSGCHWSAIPGREYTMNDCVKISFGAVFDVALREMMRDPAVKPSVAELWDRFDKHLRLAVAGMAQSIDFHLAHMHEVLPELVLDLLCRGPIERGVDASDGFRKGVDFYNLCIDGCALATVADSFAAIELRIEREARMTWEALMGHLDSNWAGEEGERARRLMRATPRYGHGGTRADGFAVRIAQRFTEIVKERPTPAGFNLIPGIFSWANTISLGKGLGATPNGRFQGDPISHGANPDPGFRKDGAATSLAVAVASVQSGWGNATPMQIELDPGICRDQKSADQIVALIQTHFRLGGTQINMNILDREKLIDAHQDPSKYPDLIVRVTGFSAYFASLSPEFRQLVVDRILRNG